jgi:methionine salvage enolase-phosphatase E1
LAAGGFEGCYLLFRQRAGPTTSLRAHRSGDLTEFIDNYFDTTTGPKTASESYRHIAAALCLPAPEVLFISDVVAELDAANAAGMPTLLCNRPGNQLQSEPLRYQISETFNDILRLSRLSHGDPAARGNK